MRRPITTMALIAICTLSAMSQTLSDDFSGTSNLWTVGAGFANDAINYYPNIVTADQSSGALVFTHAGSFDYWAANAYMTMATYDVRSKRVSAKLSRAGGLEVYLAVGESPQYMARVTLMNGGANTFVVFEAHNDRYNNPNVYIQPADFDPVQHAYFALRFTNKGIVCETSPDGLNWSAVGLLKGRQEYAATSRVEVGAGMFKPDAGAVTGTIDDVKIEP